MLWTLLKYKSISRTFNVESLQIYFNALDFISILICAAPGHLHACTYILSFVKLFIIAIYDFTEWCEKITLLPINTYRLKNTNISLPYEDHSPLKVPPMWGVCLLLEATPHMKVSPLGGLQLTQWLVRYDASGLFIGISSHGFYVSQWTSRRYYRTKKYGVPLFTLYHTIQIPVSALCSWPTGTSYISYYKAHQITIWFQVWTSIHIYIYL